MFNFEIVIKYYPYEVNSIERILEMPLEVPKAYSKSGMITCFMYIEYTILAFSLITIVMCFIHMEV